MTLREVRRNFVLGVVATLPLFLYLAVHRGAVAEPYFTFALPVLGSFPKGLVVDALLLIVVTAAAAWMGGRAGARPWLALAIAPLIAFVVAFRCVDYYYYSAVQAPFNALSLYGNLGFVQEGMAVVLAAPQFAVGAVALLAHFTAFLLWRPYRAAQRAVADWCNARAPVLVAACLAAIAVIAINAHALASNPKRHDAIRSSSPELAFVNGLPRFVRQELLKDRIAAVRPESPMLPLMQEPATRATPAKALRPHNFLVTVESFNFAYLEHQKLHPGLAQPIMPFFLSLAREALLFENIFTSSAFTVNGFVATLCSQFTMSEVVWGRDCLPELLERHGWRSYSFVSLAQLLPKHYETLGRAGLSRPRVHDTLRMRAGQQNTYLDFMMDAEVFRFAATKAGELASAGEEPLFFHVATNQMHVPGFFDRATCPEYPFPGELRVDDLTRNMINAAHCTDRDLRHFIEQLKAAGLFEEAILLITADHAINIRFWDFRESELSRIPVLLKLPASGPAPPEVNRHRLGGQVDIAPTLIDYLGLDTRRPLYGRSLLGKIDADKQEAWGISRSGLVLRARPDRIERFDSRQLAEADKSEWANFYGTVRYYDQRPDRFEADVGSARSPK